MKKLLHMASITIACAAISMAGSTQIWEQKTAEDFDKGEASGIAISSEGKLLLSPPFDIMLELGDPYAWALARDSRGRIFIGTGNEGKVYLFDGGSSSVFFKAQEIEVHALAVDSADNLYVGSSPDGKVYRVSPDGKSSVFFDPKAKYIWALAFDRSGRLYVATGDKGELFRVDQQGKGQVIYKSNGKHIRALAPYGDDGVVAGTEGQGLIVKISGDGGAFALYDAPVREITSLAIAGDGTIYAAGIGATSEPAQLTPRPVEVVSAAETTLRAIRASAPAAQQQRDAQNCEVYAIEPDGYPRRIWKSNKTPAYSIAIAPDGGILVGTGDRGLIYKISPENSSWIALVRAASSQVTALLADARSKAVYAAASNLGRLYKLGTGYSREGSFISQVKDANIFSKWGRIRWRQVAPPNTSTRFYTRSGNTREPDNTWSQWSEALVESNGQQVTSPAARFIQWKVVLSSANPGSTPAVSNVELAYLPRNVAPEIISVTLQPRDVAIEKLPAFQDQQLLPQVMTQVGAGTNSTTSTALQAPPFPRPIPSRTSIKKGWQSITWEARDENGDALSFSVYIKGEDESEWKLLKEGIEESFFSWDTTNFPDGAYLVKVVASDSPSNPADVARRGERISDRFYIDNTPPTITNLTNTTAPGSVRIRFRASDSASWLSKAEYSVDGGQMRHIFPSDGVFDSESEDFDLTITGLDAGEHTIAIKVTDRNNNQGSARILVNIRPR
jgi:hypothetical protein